MSRSRQEAQPPPGIPRRSHAAVPVAVFLLFVGLVAGAYTVIIPALLGLFLLSTAFSFLSTRLNPFSIGFYLTTKPSWTAVSLVFLAGVLLLAVAYGYYVSGFAPILPGMGSG